MINAKSATLGTVAITLFAGLAGCQTTTSHVAWNSRTAPKHVQDGQEWWSHQFVYHPREQVYFEPYLHLYFWFANDQWEEGTELPSNITLDHWIARTVKLQHEKPYVQHVTVVRWCWPYQTPLYGSTDAYHASTEAIAMSEQRSAERMGIQQASTPENDWAPWNDNKSDWNENEAWNEAVNGGASSSGAVMDQPNLDEYELLPPQMDAPADATALAPAQVDATALTPAQIEEGYELLPPQVEEPFDATALAPAQVGETMEAPLDAAPFDFFLDGNEEDEFANVFDPLEESEPQDP